jgi:Zn ribbon nucleic-acid-binding protein
MVTKKNYTHVRFENDHSEYISERLKNINDIRIKKNKKKWSMSKYCYSILRKYEKIIDNNGLDNKSRNKIKLFDEINELMKYNIYESTKNQLKHIDKNENINQSTNIDVIDIDNTDNKNINNKSFDKLIKLSIETINHPRKCPKCNINNFQLLAIDNDDTAFLWTCFNCGYEKHENEEAKKVDLELKMNLPESKKEIIKKYKL